MCAFVISVLIGLGGVMTHKVRVRVGSVSGTNTEHMEHIMKMFTKCRNTEHY